MTDPTLRVLGRAASLEILPEGRIWGAREACQTRLVNRAPSSAEETAASYACFDAEDFPAAGTCTLSRKIRH